LQHLHPDDRVALQDHIHQSVANRAAFEFEFRVIWADGTVHWIVAQGEMHPNVGEGKMLGVVRDVTESHAAEDALRRAIAVREEFLSIASHELKTPVTSLRLQLQMAERQIKPGTEDISSAERLRRHITLSVYQVERLTRLIGDLLDVTKIQAGQMDCHFEEYDVTDMIHEVLERLSEQLQDVHCGVEVNVDKPVRVRWDRSRMEQVLVNLVTNAVKYAPGKPISIEASQHGEHVILAVRDQGPGIPIEGQERIFKRFERAVSSRNISGLGLGLFIVREIVTQHGGKVHVDSRPGHGACFVVDMPQRVTLGQLPTN
jgi:signal transduction histidine kinase